MKGLISGAMLEGDRLRSQGEEVRGTKGEKNEHE